MAEPIGIMREGEIAQILLNRPKAHNEFNLEMDELLANDLIHLSTDDSVSVLVISATGKAFCTGGDLKWVVSFPNGPEAAFHELAAQFYQAVLEIRRMRKPILAAINGIAAGGGFSLALACDFRMIAKSAVFRQGYTSNGLSIDGGEACLSFPG